jgi:hypothetical protein
MEQRSNQPVGRGVGRDISLRNSVSCIGAVAGLRIEAPAGGKRPIIFVDNVCLGIGQELAGLQKFVEIGDQPDFVA